MYKKLTLIATLGLMAILASRQAAAQPMDMSAMIRQQVALQAQGDAHARAVARQYYNYMLRLRRQGYTGPSLPTGVTAATLNAANQRLQQTMDNYHTSSMINSRRTSNAIDATGAAITRGCQTINGPYGRVRICP